MTHQNHQGIQILEEVLDPTLMKTLETLAAVNEEDIKILDNGFKFQFERSLVANHCMVVKYMDKLIVEFRKKTDGIIEGKTDRLVFEDTIKAKEFGDVFERVTGIYISYI